MADLVKVDILLQGEAVDAFSAIVHKDKAYNYGVEMTKKLRELIPRQQFEVADPGGHRRARHRPREHPRDPQGRPRQVLRRRHLPQAQAAGKQKEGKKRMKMVGRVEVPQEAFIAALSTDSDGPKKEK
ncbi:hypothetical protein ACU686_17865 [Yinghuangia aomiensis]